jgi:hypothetical protein
MAQIYGPNIVTDGLILSVDAGDRNSYPGSGTTWIDTSGNGRNATINGTATLSSSDPKNFSITNPSAPTQTNFFSFSPGSTSGYNPMYYSNCTINVAFRWNNTNTYWERIFDFGRGGNNSGTYGTNAFIFSRLGTSTDMVVRTHGGVTQFSNDGFAPMNVGTWQIWTITWTAGSQLFYKNGSLYASYTNAYSLVDHLGSTRLDEQYYLGKSNWNDAGAIISYGPFFIYNRILSAQEVLQNYNAQKSRFNL